MAIATEIASDVVTDGTALAGLILVYIGGIAASFATFRTEDQQAIRGRFQARAWFAFVGVVFAILSAGFALIGKWVANESIAAIAIGLLMIALLWGVAIAILSVREIA